MKSDTEIREDVIRELLWDPLVPDSHAIGVAVKDGTVTLTGRTPAYAEKLAAVRAASRVDGVKAVVDELKVRLSGEPRDDSEIARAIAHALHGNTYIGGGQVHARVERGWVTLLGRVEWDYQRHEVERMVRSVRGVLGITNNISVVSP
jgi:osmotically-inducible protein OsmY